jgi:hypothetical protein
MVAYGGTRPPSFVASGQPLVLAPEMKNIAEQQPTTVEGRSEREVLQAGLQEWARARFEAAGLGLPPLEFVYPADEDDCDGWVGLVSRENDRLVIKSCAGGGELRHNLLHELAHAWDMAGGIPEETRRQFLEMRGLDSWRGADVDWNRRGQEHAAEIVAWGLELAQQGIPTPVAEVGHQDSDSLRRAYLLLTGQAPLWDVPGG